MNYKMNYKFIVMMMKIGSYKIKKFMAPGSGVVFGWGSK